MASPTHHAAASKSLATSGKKAYANGSPQHRLQSYQQTSLSGLLANSSSPITERATNRHSYSHPHHKSSYPSKHHRKKTLPLPNPSQHAQPFKSAPPTNSSNPHNRSRRNPRASSNPLSQNKSTSKKNARRKPLLCSLKTLFLRHLSHNRKRHL